MSDSLSGQIQNWSRQIQRNEVTGLLSQILSAVSKATPSVGQMTQIASLCRRLGAPRHGVKLLRSVLFIDRELKITADADALIEYAAGLSRLGISSEALKWLGHPICRDRGQALWQAGTAHITNWNYRAAREQLVKALSRGDITDYQKLIVESNLAACAMFLDMPNRESMISQLLDKTSHPDAHLLHQNLKLLQLENFVLSDRLDELRLALREFDSNPSTGTEHFRLQLEKWRAVAQAREDKSQAIQRLGRLGELAYEKGYWELRRDCLFYLANISSDQESLVWLHRVTPFLTFRERIERSPIFKPYTDRDIYLAKPGSLSRPSEFQALRLRDQVRFPEAEGRVFRSLVNNILRPSSLSETFGGAFPDETYIPGYSERRVSRIIERVRSRLGSLGFGPLIHIKSAEIRLEFEQAKVAVQLDSLPDQASMLPPPRLGLLLEVLKGQSEFTIQDICKTLGVSQPTAKRLASQWQNGGWTLGVGSNRHRRYLKAA